MSGFVGSLFRNLLGFSDTGISVPPMDSMFKPNSRLDRAERLARIDGLDDLAPTPDGLVCSGGDGLYAVRPGSGAAEVRELDRLDGAITFLAAAPDGRLALATEEGGVRIGRPGAWESLDLPPEQARCVTAGRFLADGTLALCIGSIRNPASEWKRDLMQHGASGCVLAVDPGDRSVRTLADGLAFPYGAASFGADGLAVSECWRHRVVEIGGGGRAIGDRGLRTLLSDLPAYPARLAAAEDGGFRLALFAPRRQLFEMILSEDEYRLEMMETIDPSEWVGPDLRHTNGPDQPLLQGSVRQMGILKPWAPSGSYGLAVRCDHAMAPLESWHSRADGTMHGITSVCTIGGATYAASKGAGMLLRLDDATTQGEAEE